MTFPWQLLMFIILPLWNIIRSDVAYTIDLAKAE